MNNHDKPNIEEVSNNSSVAENIALLEKYCKKINLRLNRFSLQYDFNVLLVTLTIIFLTDSYAPLNIFKSYKNKLYREYKNSKRFENNQGISKNICYAHCLWYILINVFLCSSLALTNV